MRLDTTFVRLPLTFDAERLRNEVSTIEEEAWRPHPQGFAGNSALPMIAVNGDPDDDNVKGAMRPTPYLERCPYLRQVLAAFQAVWGRTRLMRLDGNAEATAHTDTNYYWTYHARVHVPIVTGEHVEFRCGNDSVHMAAGEAWIFDTWQVHNVINPHPTRRIHLVADTVGSAIFWEMAEQGMSGAVPAQFVAYDPLRAPVLAFESFNHPQVMPPAEQRALVDLLLSVAPPDAQELRKIVLNFNRDWTAAYARFAEAREGLPLYRNLVNRAEASLKPLQGMMRLENHLDAAEAVRNVILRPALGEEEAPRTRPRSRMRRIERPIFIVCPPRSGSSLFFETLAQSPSLWSVGGESHSIIESIAPLHPSQRRFHSNRLDAQDATPDVVHRLEHSFLNELRDREGRRPRPDATGLRLLEKTPKNSLRVPFLAHAFPDAFFIYLYRDMRDTISSMLDAWRSGKFVTYPRLPDWDGPAWSLLLTPGWRELSGKSLAEIVASQWSTATRYLLDDLEQLHPDRWCLAGYDDLVNEPQKEVERLARFLEFDWDRQLAAPLPLSQTTLTEPSAEKWRRNAEDLKVALPLVANVAERARNLFANPPTQGRKRAQAGAAVKAPPQSANDFRSSFTATFAEMLDRAGATLFISTYQSGRLILARIIDGQVNTHFRAFASPMGIALSPQSLTLGTKNFVWYFRAHAGLAATLDEGRVDVAYVPASAHATGDIAVHELAYTRTGLVMVNTKFSCLASIDSQSSFREVWRPPFITQLAAEDRCHLNGVAIENGAARYVTALGESNEPAGWRARKADGGILIDVATNEIVARGLSMPHSPRIYDGRLWILESGEGRLCTVDATNGKTEVIAEVPGFARGLAFAGQYAFIGLSQVREKLFDGITVARFRERNCGVWVVDIRTGSTVGFVRFEGIVQEIFDVQILHGARHPEVLEPTDDNTGRALTLS